MFLCLILLFVALLLIVTALLIVNLQRRLPVTNGTRCLLLIAHPDDECMFFTPSIIQLLRQHCKFYVLCVSTGKNFCEFNNFLQFSRKCRRVGPFAQRRVIWILPRVGYSWHECDFNERWWLVGWTNEMGDRKASTNCSATYRANGHWSCAYVWWKRHKRSSKSYLVFSRPAIFVHKWIGATERSDLRTRNSIIAAQIHWFPGSLPELLFSHIYGSMFAANCMVGYAKAQNPTCMVPILVFTV
jgi:hypothetical protein